jgi:hypothetical protein
MWPPRAFTHQYWAKRPIEARGQHRQPCPDSVLPWQQTACKTGKTGQHSTVDSVKRRLTLEETAAIPSYRGRRGESADPPSDRLLLPNRLLLPKGPILPSSTPKQCPWCQRRVRTRLDLPANASCAWNSTAHPHSYSPHLSRSSFCSLYLAWRPLRGFSSTMRDGFG